MNAEIEKLIKLAAEGGSISDRQFEIILRKAQEAGEDLDEIELTLENELSKHQKSENTQTNVSQRPKKNIRKCPKCGAIVSQSSLLCPECGYDFMEQSEASANMQKEFERLKEQLIQIENENKKEAFWDIVNQERLRKKQAVITGFHLPKTKEGLIQFMEFSYSCYIGEGEYGPMRNTWRGKFMQAYHSLKALENDDPEVASFLKIYSRMAEAENKVEDSKRKQEVINNKYSSLPIMKIGCLGIIAMMIIIPFIMIRCDNNADKPIMEEINSLILESKYDEALNKTITLNSDAQRKNTQDDIYKKQIEALSSTDIDGALEIALKINSDYNRKEIYDDLVVIKIETLIKDGKFEEAQNWSDKINNAATRKDVKRKIK